MGRAAGRRAAWLAAVDVAGDDARAAAALMRLFVAVRLPEELAADLAARAQEAAGAELRVIPAENLHVTVCFLGAVEEARASELTQDLAQACAASEAFTLRLETLTPAPHRRPRMLWARARPQPAYDALADAVAAAAAPYAPEAPPLHTGPAHITLARMRGRARPGTWPDPARLDATIDVGALHLIRSERGPGGSAYTPLAELHLR
jgi:2'-5' RNA ligase